jgi:signal transduction histidine kinase/CheY-like chemotaxis protein
MLTFTSVVAQVNDATIEKLIGTQQDDPGNFQQLVDSSNIYYFEGNYKKSLAVNIFLLNRALEENDTYNIHRGYRHLGYDYLAMNDTLLAEESFEKSEKFAILSKNDTATATTYMDLANLYATLKSDTKKALVYHNKSIQLYKQIKDSAGLAKAHYNTILTALDAKEYSKAFLHLVKAKKLKDFDSHPSFGIGIEVLFGEYYLAKKNYMLADIHLGRAIAEAKAENLTVELQDAYDLYSTSLFEQKKFEEAYKVRMDYETYYEESLTDMSSEEMGAMSAKFQVEEYRKDMLAAELENSLQAEIVKNKNRLNIILMIVSICAVILFLVSLFAFRKRKKLIQLLRDKNTEYLKAKKRSEKLARAKGKFFSTVSHELRTPLYGVIGLSSILLEDETLDNHKKDLKALKFSADYLLALINNVLHINKIDSNSIDDDCTIFNVRELFESITASFEYTRLQNNNKIHIIVSENIPQLLKGNSVRLSQVLMNLIGNACKFTEDGNIYVKAYPHQINDDTVLIDFSVQDTGMGIAQEKFSTIFDEFSQLETNNYSYQGTGLGLPIVKKLLSQSKSEIRLQSQLGRGSTFSFTLPYEISHPSKTEVEPTALDVNLLKGKKILVAEDNRINQMVTRKILEKNGVVCTIAENGQQAVNLSSEEKFDFILMDLNMPIKNGFEACKEIRAMNQNIPIVALTAVEVEEVRNEIYLAGMNDIVVKPYDVTKFIQTILINLGPNRRPIITKKDQKAAV